MKELVRCDRILDCQIHHAEELKTLGLALEKTVLELPESRVDGINIEEHLETLHGRAQQTIAHWRPKEGEVDELLELVQQTWDDSKALDTLIEDAERRIDAIEQEGPKL